MYNKIHRTVIVTIALQTELHRGNLSDMNVNIYSEWNCVENILLRSKRNVCVGIVLKFFKFLNVVRYIFNVWGEIIKDPNAHIM